MSYFASNLLFLMCMCNINKKITGCTLDIQKPIQNKPHIFGIRSDHIFLK